MLMLHILLAPLIGIPVLGLLRKKLYRDAAVFGAVSVIGYGLWVCVVNQRPFIITIFIARMIEMLKSITTVMI
ncbi:hypothetical protein LOK74_09330 [Brevibacillus humidisoli]|uniref:hypothetical protein n=1 Tax=Brevibacillus humidisoli TaxID=2895522 RepID=UPI001E2EEC8A|nr:hypothetical protein [Brevibacillus humidisoli]UFJ43267.1 hypothetical protein LOK74_09330 [Brevibacillus humidisoli]